MKQMLIETRHKAEELLQEALSIWRQSDQADYLEDIEKDPVFSLLIMALAYQANEVDAEIERLKGEVMEDFAKLLVPYEMGHATPATAVVAVKPQDKLPEVVLGENTVFTLGGIHPFLPLLATRVLPAEVRTVVRLDGRRWKLTLNFGHPVTDLSHFAFAFTGTDFRNLRVSLKGTVLPLIKPWQYAELPLAPYFAPDALTYNQGQEYTMSMLPLDLFARQNLRMFCFDSMAPIPETESLDLVFEFSGIRDDFVFDKSSLVLNPVLLVNADLREASLSTATPLVRLSGEDPDPDEKDLSARHFLHLVRPMETQLFGNMELEVRGVAGDRFNQGSLLKLLSSLIARYRSDFYAFQHLKGSLADSELFRLEQALVRMQETIQEDVNRNVSGVYLMPRDRSSIGKKDFSLTVKYLTTAGAALNQQLSQGVAFTAPDSLVPSNLKMLTVPIPGTDEIKDSDLLSGLLRYQLVTGDRLVTMADIKLFCKKELLLRYGIGDNIVRSIRVRRRLQQDAGSCGYEIVAEITLLGNGFVRRNFESKMAAAEILLQQMIAVRSTNIYPVRVMMTIEEEQKEEQ